MGRKRANRRYIIGLDLGTSTGYSLFEILDNETIMLLKSGVWDISRSKFQGGGMQIVMFEAFFYRLVNNLRGEIFLGYEMNRFMARGNGPDAHQFYGALVFHVMFMCEKVGIPYIGMAPSTIKKLAAGKGNLGKDIVRATMEKLFNKKFGKKDDESDAVACGYAMARKLQWLV